MLGFDAAGTVEAVGSEVTTLEIGDEVWYAGEVTARAPTPNFRPSMSGSSATVPAAELREAAALPLTTITAWESLFDRFRLTRESTGTLLIMGAPAAWARS